LRLAGHLFNHAFKILAHLYDLIIMVPLGAERLIRATMSNALPPGRDA
jgi:hypothetical protein